MLVSPKPMFHTSLIAICLMFLSPSLSIEANACTCVPSPNRSLCELGDEANTGQDANFLAIVELSDSTMSGGIATFTVDVVELLAGTLPIEDIFLVQLSNATCGQYNYIELGAKGVLVGNLVNGLAFPNYCELHHSFFRMNMDTVFVPFYNSTGIVDQPYLLADFHSDDCENVSRAQEVIPADEDFSLSYSSQTQVLEVVTLDPSVRAEYLIINIYSSNGQHILEANPQTPIDLSSMPPGMYAILIRDEQRAWSKAFVKPN